MLANAAAAASSDTLERVLECPLTTLFAGVLLLTLVQLLLLPAFVELLLLLLLLLLAPLLVNVDAAKLTGDKPGCPTLDGVVYIDMDADLFLPTLRGVVVKCCACDVGNN